MSGLQSRAASSGAPRIVVVDDDTSVGALLDEMLRQAGCEVVWFADARQALIHLRTQPCDLVVLDVFMPECDGFEVLTRFSRIPDAPRVLAISGAHGDQLRIARLLGADASLAKPFRRQEFLREAERLCGKPFLGDEAAPTVVGLQTVRE